MRDQTLSVRSDIYGERTPSTHHPQGEPPSSGSGPSASPRIPTAPDAQTPRPTRGVGVIARSGLKGEAHDALPVGSASETVRPRWFPLISVDCVEGQRH